MYAEASNRAEGGPNAAAIGYVNAIGQEQTLHQWSIKSNRF